MHWTTFPTNRCPRIYANTVCGESQRFNLRKVPRPTFFIFVNNIVVCPSEFSERDAPFTQHAIMLLAIEGLELWRGHRLLACFQHRKPLGQNFLHFYVCFGSGPFNGFCVCSCCGFLAVTDLRFFCFRIVHRRRRLRFLTGAGFRGDFFLCLGCHSYST